MHSSRRFAAALRHRSVCVRGFWGLSALQQASQRRDNDSSHSPAHQPAFPPDLESRASAAWAKKRKVVGWGPTDISTQHCASHGKARALKSQHMEPAGSSGQADDAPRSDDPPEARRDEEAGMSPRNELAAPGGVFAPVLCSWPGQLTSIVWLRRDLRMDDNPALNAALKTGGNVVSGAFRARAPWRTCSACGWASQKCDESSLLPSAQVCVFIWAPEDEGVFYPGRCSRWWLHQSLKSLSASFRKLGSRLILRRAQQVSPTREVFASTSACRPAEGGRSLPALLGSQRQSSRRDVRQCKFTFGSLGGATRAAGTVASRAMAVPSATRRRVGCQNEWSSAVVEGRYPRWHRLLGSDVMLALRP